MRRDKQDSAKSPYSTTGFCTGPALYPQKGRLKAVHGRKAKAVNILFRLFSPLFPASCKGDACIGQAFTVSLFISPISDSGTGCTLSDSYHFRNAPKKGCWIVNSAPPQTRPKQIKIIFRRFPNLFSVVLPMHLYQARPKVNLNNRILLCPIVPQMPFSSLKMRFTPPVTASVIRAQRRHRTVSPA